MLENRDHVYDPHPGKGFTREKLAQLQEILKKPAGYRAQDKLHTDTLGHLKEWGKITKKKISLYLCHCGNVVHDLHQEVSKPVDNDVVFWGLLQKKLCVKHKASMIVNLLTPRLAPAASDLLCPAGRSGCSCHVMAVIWKLEMSRNNEMKNQCDNDVPCAT